MRLKFIEVNIFQKNSYHKIYIFNKTGVTGIGTPACCSLCNFPEKTQQYLYINIMVYLVKLEQGSFRVRSSLVKALSVGFRPEDREDHLKTTIL